LRNKKKSIQIKVEKMKGKKKIFLKREKVAFFNPKLSLLPLNVCQAILEAGTSLFNQILILNSDFVQIFLLI